MSFIIYSDFQISSSIVLKQNRLYIHIISLVEAWANLYLCIPCKLAQGLHYWCSKCIIKFDKDSINHFDYFILFKGHPEIDP